MLYSAISRQMSLFEEIFTDLSHTLLKIRYYFVLEINDCAILFILKKNLL